MKNSGYRAKSYGKDDTAQQSALILSRDEALTVEDLPMRVRGYPDVYPESAIGEEGLEHFIRGVSEKLEKEYIVKTLEKHNDNRTATAEALKISRKTLFNKMKQYGLL